MKRQGSSRSCSTAAAAKTSARRSTAKASRCAPAIIAPSPSCGASALRRRCGHRSRSTTRATILTRSSTRCGASRRRSDSAPDRRPREKRRGRSPQSRLLTDGWSANGSPPCPGQRRRDSVRDKDGMLSDFRQSHQFAEGAARERPRDEQIYVRDAGGTDGVTAEIDVDAGSAIRRDRVRRRRAARRSGWGEGRALSARDARRPPPPKIRRRR